MFIFVMDSWKEELLLKYNGCGSRKEELEQPSSEKAISHHVHGYNVL